MPTYYPTDYLRMGDEAVFTRAGMRAWQALLLAGNAQHFHGTRVRQLVSDVDIWRTPPGGGFDTGLEYLVTVSSGATVLLGSIVWGGFVRDLQERVRLDVRFYSERGGAGVAAGLDTVTSAQVGDEMAGLGYADAWERPLDFFEVPNSLVPDRPMYVQALGGQRPTWIRWQPDLTTSREQRVQVQVDATSIEVPYVWGVYLYEMVPMNV